MPRTFKGSMMPHLHDYADTKDFFAALHARREHVSKQEEETKCRYDICDGSGEIAEDVFDIDSHEYQRGVGRKKCICKLEDPGEADEN